MTSEYIAGEYDIAVVGAGHAGCEAALASARLGCKTVVFSLNLDVIANMPCNPSIGGTAKGHLVREIDALGGEMGKATDKTFIQSKMLNSAKGPAVFSLRAQVDRKRYHIEMKNTLESQEGLDVRQAEIVELLVDESDGVKKVSGVKTHTGAIYKCNAVILATGTYLKGKVIIGEVSFSSGPDGLLPANKLSESLKSHGIILKRFKTGTPPRLNRRSVDFTKTIEQSGDEVIVPFSFDNDEIEKEQVNCYLTYTNAKTHQIIKNNIHRSPLYSGMIEGIGPRYCPSIEYKVMKFADKESHQVFIEPMGEDTQEMYLQGMSSSLPEDVQEQVVRSLPGLENVMIMRMAYAIEYDCIDPTELSSTLEYKGILGLYGAGQINRSSGYEEAAAQGLMAGMNAALKIKGLEPVALGRDDGYIGVLIDDLVTKGTNEPYRMMTSRAEYRLLLRQDNADLRLTPIGHEVGLVNDEKYQKTENKRMLTEIEIERLKKTNVSPNNDVNSFLESKQSTIVKSGISLYELLKRPEINYKDLAEIDKSRPEMSLSVAEQVEISVKYEGYIKRQLSQVEQFKKLENKRLSEDIDYSGIHGLRIEARQKLDKIRPNSIGQASRISGVTPSDISVLLIYLEQLRRR